MSEAKHTVILGASTNPTRYAHMAAESPEASWPSHDFCQYQERGTLWTGVLDLRSEPAVSDVDTLTLYVGSQNLEQWKNYMLSLAPKRIIFNPGTEHQVIAELARAKGIEVVFGCTLVMLSTGQY